LKRFQQVKSRRVQRMFMSLSGSIALLCIDFGRSLAAWFRIFDSRAAAVAFSKAG